MRRRKDAHWAGNWQCLAANVLNHDRFDRRTWTPSGIGGEPDPDIALAACHTNGNPDVRQPAGLIRNKSHCGHLGRPSSRAVNRLRLATDASPLVIVFTGAGEQRLLALWRIEASDTAIPCCPSVADIVVTALASDRMNFAGWARIAERASAHYETARLADILVSLRILGREKQSV